MIRPGSSRKLRQQDLPDGAFLRHEYVRASVHSGSHIDAPGHYGLPSPPLKDGMISEAPLSSFVGKGVCIDVSADSTEAVSLQEFRSRLDQIQKELHGEIVLICTGSERPISVEVIEYCLDSGCSVIGTDNDSFDGVFSRMIELFERTGDKSFLWPAHMLGRKRPYYQIERLRNLQLLPRSGFLICAAPILISGTTAAWTRAFALVPRGAPCV